MGRFSRAARVGDSERGRCDLHIHNHSHSCPHFRAGSMDSGSPNVFFNGKAAVRLGDGGSCHCVHSGSFKVSSGSGSVFINGKAAIRIKDDTTCTTCGKSGNIITGSSNIFIGD